MNDQKNVNKRRLLVRWIALAVSLLIIAAIIVTAVAAANNWFKPVATIDSSEKPSSQQKPEDDKNTQPGGDKDVKPDDGKPEEDKKPEEGATDNPANANTTFAMPISSADVTCDYDFVCNQSMCGIWYFHEAIDMAAEEGANVVCCLDGTVECITVDDFLDGTTVKIAHANGISTSYSFINAREGLKAGDKVSRGDVIGTVAKPCGNEYLQGAHLHFAVFKDGKAENPADYLEATIK